MTKSRSPLKVGFVLDGGLNEPDGVQQYILSLGKYYKSLGMTVRYLVSGPAKYGGKDVICLNRNIGVRSNGNRLAIPLPSFSRRLKTVLEQEKFDVLHVQMPYSPLMGERLILLAKPATAVIGTFHIVPRSLVLNIGDWLLGGWSQRSVRHFDSIVSVSRAAQRIARRDYHVNSTVLPNVVDFYRFNRAEPLPSLRSGSRLNILFLGRLVERKGCLVLLKAVKLLADTKNLPDFQVIVCGKGPLLKTLQEFVSNNKLDRLVEFKGFISEDDKPKVLSSADIAVFPSSGGESFGIVLLEAMASGRAAVLAGDNEGYRSVMQSQPDLIFPSQDVAQLAAKLIKLLKDADLRQTYADWGEAYAKTFDVKVIGDKLLDTYKEALAKRSLSLS